MRQDGYPDAGGLHGLTPAAPTSRDVTSWHEAENFVSANDCGSYLRVQETCRAGSDWLLASLRERQAL